MHIYTMAIEEAYTMEKIAGYYKYINTMGIDLIFNMMK